MKRAFGVLAAAVLVATPIRGQELVEYVHLDALGSVRAVSNQANQVIERHDYLPFGEECTTGPCTSNPGAGGGQPRKFTGKERDQETGLDYFGARYHGARIGRFTTVDPVYTWRENLADPQRWNRYAYARDNPLRYVDPDGRQVAEVIRHAGMGLRSQPDPRGVVVGGALIFVATQLENIVHGLEAAAEHGVPTYPVDHLRIPAHMSEAVADPSRQLPEKAGPTGHISPGEVSGKTPAEIDARAKELGLKPMGPDPAAGRGSYIDPQTGEQRILVHPAPKGGAPHGHVNDASGSRIGPGGRVVPAESKEAHLPIKEQP
jgi:RHS repeat-associated protein